MTKLFQISTTPPFQSNTAALIANGAIHDYRLIKEMVDQYRMIIAVDGGLIHCHQMGIKPDCLIGDLDSAPQELVETYAQIEKKKFAVEKDETDLELAILFANEQGAERIGIFGALEKRTDHALYNLHLLRRYPRKVFLETESETLFALDGSNEIRCFPGQKLSLIPLGSPPKGVTTRGLKWELDHSILDKDFMSVSNVCKSSQVAIEIENGDLICCLSKG